MRGAGLGGANLHQAKLFFADLQNVSFRGANLELAELEYANLRGADLMYANLRIASFDESVTLPDGTKWMKGTDIERLTNPEYPRFGAQRILPHQLYQALGNQF